SLSFEAYKGKVLSIIGANGCGKTTLLKVIAGIKKPYSGRVKVNGKIAYMPQNPRYLFTQDTVGDEIDYETAKKFCLDSFLNHHPYDLSGGQMQKLALAILSQQDFDILLLDEPSKALDKFFKADLIDYIKALAKSGKTVIIVSHDLDFVGDVSDYVSFLSDSVITVTGSRRQVLSLLNYYTTQIRRITKAHLNSAVSTEDLK
ncbi:MAG: ABC transporter ATP-binding protein, partial [Eubacterium sp.]